MFRDRTEAGARLAADLAHLKDEDPVILALPRGGVPVGYEVAKALGAPLDIVLVRKIGSPYQPELAAGAVVDGANPVTVINDDVVRTLGIDQDWIEGEASRQLQEIERRRQLYMAGRSPIDVRGRTAIVVDDGIATGATTRAALRGLRASNPKRLVLAVPVAPPDTLEALRPEVDEIVAVETPAYMGAIGAFYDDFRQLEDREVIDVLEQAAKEHSFRPR